MTTIKWKTEDGHVHEIKAYCNYNLLASIIELILNEDYCHIMIYPDGREK